MESHSEWEVVVTAWGYSECTNDHVLAFHWGKALHQKTDAQVRQPSMFSMPLCDN